MMVKKNHMFHLVDMSPWPILSSLSSMIMMSGLVKVFFSSSWGLFFLGFTMISVVSFSWWRDVIRESCYQGIHTSIVILGMKLGMVLFIVSEIFFFLSFFWGFFHSSLSPSFELGLVWPPAGVISFSPVGVPLLNTLILLSSGFSITLSHHLLCFNNMKMSFLSLGITILFGVYFSFLQYLEYQESSFSISDSVYGSIFFMATGFHGIHVIIGSMFLMVCFVRMGFNQFSCFHHFGFEAAAWYWHFVDVVWLFLYMNLYWWGS